MFKSILLAAFAVVAFSGAAEAARPDTRNMTCRQAVDFVRRNAPVVVNYGYGSGGPLYSRVNTQPCGRPGEGSNPIWVPTRDSASCYIGYTCN